MFHKRDVKVGVNQWKRYVVTYLDEDGSPRVESRVTNKSVGEETKFIKNIVSISELEGKPTSRKCLKCGKPFEVGDVVYNTDLFKHTIVLLDTHLAYFGETYQGEDILDIHEQTRYLVHADHVSQDQLDRYKRGKLLWQEGMNLCHTVKGELFPELR